jgi:hypothetical protein
MSWFSEYKKSLKNIYAEEFFDVFLYRPIGFIIVKTFYSLPITPNQYSLLALISGIFSSYYFYQGTELGFRLGAFFFFMFAVLDCCDGMVARLKKNGTEFGRLIDGLVDYSVNIIVYFALGFGCRNLGLLYGIPVWIFVILSGVSKAIHSITYDHYLTEYLSYEKGNLGFASNELESLNQRYIVARENNDSLKAFALKIYIGYTAIQLGKEKKPQNYNPKEYCQKNLMTLKLWSVIGPAVHITFLILAFILNVPNLYFFYAIVFGNIWLVLMFLFQFKTNNSLNQMNPRSAASL